MLCVSAQCSKVRRSIVQNIEASFCFFSLGLLHSRLWSIRPSVPLSFYPSVPLTLSPYHLLPISPSHHLTQHHLQLYKMKSEIKIRRKKTSISKTMPIADAGWLWYCKRCNNWHCLSPWPVCFCLYKRPLK